jgi:hypothetical protein
MTEQESLRLVDWLLLVFGLVLGLVHNLLDRLLHCLVLAVDLVSFHISMSAAEERTALGRIWSQSLVLGT